MNKFQNLKEQDRETFMDECLHPGYNNIVRQEVRVIYSNLQWFKLPNISSSNWFISYSYNQLFRVTDHDTLHAS